MNLQGPLSTFKDAETIKAMLGNKVDIYVLGTSALFNNKDDKSYKERIDDLKELLKTK